MTRSKLAALSTTLAVTATVTAVDVEPERDAGLNYVSRILDKLQVADRTQAALRARDGV